MWGRLAMSVIPGIFGLLDVVLCEFLGDTNSESALSCPILAFDSMDALEAVRPSMLADITICAVERLLAVCCRHRMVWCCKNLHII